MTIQRIVGIDLGGARGKTTAVVDLRCDGSEHTPGLAGTVADVALRSPRGPWTDDALCEFLANDVPSTLVAIAAPLSLTACATCILTACPGVAACPSPQTNYLRGASTPKRALLPYLHRPCEARAFERGEIGVPHMGAATGPLAARGAHLVRRLTAQGYALGTSLLEVIPGASVHAIFGPKLAKAYKRDANPWVTRVRMLDALPDLGFHAKSGFSRDAALRNDHGFDALIAAYTGLCIVRGEGSPPAASESGVDHWIAVPTLRQQPRLSIANK